MILYLGRNRTIALTIDDRNEKIIAAITKATKKGTASRKIARTTLIKEGMYTHKGEITSHYRGATRTGSEVA